MKDMTRQKRRFKTKNIVEKRKNILKNIWKQKDNLLLFIDGKLKKFNLSCNCNLCKYDKKNKIIKKKYKYIKDDN